MTEQVLSNQTMTYAVWTTHYQANQKAFHCSWLPLYCNFKNPYRILVIVFNANYCMAFLKLLPRC